MRIAFVANWWYRRGGLGAVMLDEAAVLEARGHTIEPFAAAHPDNLDVPTSSYFPSFVETSEAGSGMPAWQRARTMLDILDNRDAAARFGALLDDRRPDLVHVHNTTRQLSPSVLAAARARRLPIVMTMHDYGLICPQGLLLRGGTTACDPPLCAGGNTFHAVRHRCIKGSLAASGAGALELWLHRRRGAYTRTIDVLIAPSRFIEATVRVAGGWSGPIRYLPNGIVDRVASTGSPPGRTMLFVGRLVPEKGVDVLLDAARAAPEIDVIIAGDGPESGRLKSIAPPNVRFVGHQSPAGIEQLLGESTALIVPSVWFENAPLSIIEAMRAGRAVIASDLGGSAELLADGAGLLVPAGDVAALTVAMHRLSDDADLAAAMGARGRRSFEARFTLDRHVDGLLGIYEDAIAGFAPNS